MASIWQSWIQASQRNSYPLAHLTGNFYFSSDSETLLLEFGEHWASRLMHFPCATPKVPWPGFNSVENRLWHSILTSVFKNKHLFILWPEASTGCSTALQNCLWKLTSLGPPNISSSSLHLPLVNLPKMSFQRTKLQHSRGDEKLLFTSHWLAKVSL